MGSLISALSTPANLVQILSKFIVTESCCGYPQIRCRFTTNLTWPAIEIRSGYLWKFAAGTPLQIPTASIFRDLLWVPLRIVVGTLGSPSCLLEIYWGKPLLHYAPSSGDPLLVLPQNTSLVLPERCLRDFASTPEEPLRVHLRICCVSPGKCYNKPRKTRFGLLKWPSVVEKGCR